MQAGDEYFLTVEIRCALPNLTRIAESVRAYQGDLDSREASTDPTAEESLEYVLDSNISALEERLIEEGVELRSAVISCARIGRFDHSEYSFSNRISRHYAHDPEDIA